MTMSRQQFRSFLRAESGAITVDYVMLAAAVTAVALASSGVITQGLGVMAGNIDNELSGRPAEAVTALSYSNGFDNGSEGWSGADASNINGVGNVLGPITGSGGAQSISRDFDIDPDAEEATFTFDLLALDSLDGESGIVFIDGREVGRMTTDWKGGTIFTPAADLPEGMTFTAELVEDRVDLGGAAGNRDFLDSRASIKVSIRNPAERVTFGFGSNADQGSGDESFAIDNFRATGLRDPDRPSGGEAGT